MFLDELKHSDNSLYSYVDNCILNIKPYLNNINKSKFIEYTDHSINHSERVLELAYKLNEKNSLSCFEIAILILAAYYHDIGMFVTEEEFSRSIAEIENHGNYEALSDDIVITEQLKSCDNEIKKYFLSLDYFRRNHASRSCGFIAKEYPPNDKQSFYNDKYFLWEAVKLICLAHTLDSKQLENEGYLTNYPVGNGVFINLLYLALLLRLADICHFSRDRAYPYYFRVIDFISKKSESIWQYYADIVDTNPNTETNLIEVSALCTNFYNHRAIIENTKTIQRELEVCHLLLSKNKSNYQLPWKLATFTNITQSTKVDYIYFNTKFELNHLKIINLLMGNKLYRDPLFALRECIQNSIDALNVFCKKTNSSDNYILVDLKKEGEQYFLDIFDTGTGMDKEIINNYFLSVGSKSFWYSKRGFNDWGITNTNVKLIADHGIGVLSYFMIASKLEIFTVYHNSREYNHVYIENYTDGIVFKNTPKELFPGFNCKEIKCSPWDLNHGTCIRFHLKEYLDFSSVMTFIAKHILRSNYRIVVNYPDINKEVTHVWHFRGYLDRHCINKNDDSYYWAYYDQNSFEKETSNDENNLLQLLYDPPVHFYEGPPKDSAIEDNLISEDNIKGYIHLNYLNETAMPCRISQSGILIEDAIEFITKRQSRDSLLIKAFGFDINIDGINQFQLDAERTRIVECDYNERLFDKVIKILNKKYLEQISKIESPVYFPCGGTYYHGLIDVIFSKEGAVKCFHENFKNVFKHIKDYKQYFNEPFNKAKLYMAGFERNKPLSVDEIKTNIGLYKIIVMNPIIIKWEKESLNKKSGPRIIKRVDTLLNRLDNKDILIFLPDNTDTFLFPLYNTFDFNLILETEYFRIIEICNKYGQSIKDKIKLFEEFDKYEKN